MQTRLLTDYNPQNFFYWFEEITRIPRQSNHEEKMTAFLVQFAEKRNLCCKVDDVGNVLITLPASLSFEKEPPILLQGHMDMVCVKDEGVDFDFSKDPIKMRIEGNLLRACGTTLGADNATGVATMLAIADDSSISHPPMELLFTVQEEVGLQGIRNYDMSNIKARRMINLDSGYSHQMCVCSAGASKCIVDKAFDLITPPDLVGMKLEIAGGIGGHSGVRIHLGRACAGNLVGELLHALRKKLPVYLKTVRTNDTAILNECTVEFAVERQQVQNIKEILARCWEQIKVRYAVTDKNITCTVTETEAPCSVLNSDSSRQIIDLLYLFHTGAHKHDGIDPTIVVASSSILSCKLLEGQLEFRFQVRSVDDTVRELLVGRYSEIANLLGVELQVVDSYPGWPVWPNSPMQERFKTAHRELFGEEIAVEYMHAGVEVGVIVDAIPDMDAVGISATATNAHTTKEDLYLDEVQPFWDLLLKVLQA